MITREQIKYCFTQATQAGRFSQEYCIDRLMELLSERAAAMNPQPVSLADELRKLVESIKGYIAVSTNYEVQFPYDVEGHAYHHGAKEAFQRCADELSALLAQHAVAEPQRVLTEHQRKVEEAAGMPIDWGMANASTAAHAAEQPKLTEATVLLCDSVQKFLNEEGGPDNTTNRVALRISLVRARRELTLLTSPVAPPHTLKEKP